MQIFRLSILLVLATGLAAVSMLIVPGTVEIAFSQAPPTTPNPTPRSLFAPALPFETKPHVMHMVSRVDSTIRGYASVYVPVGWVAENYVNEIFAIGINEEAADNFMVGHRLPPQSIGGMVIPVPAKVLRNLGEQTPDEALDTQLDNLIGQSCRSAEPVEPTNNVGFEYFELNNKTGCGKVLAEPGDVNIQKYFVVLKFDSGYIVAAFTLMNLQIEDYRETLRLIAAFTDYVPEEIDPDDG